jgi:hypothetical protein
MNQTTTQSWASLVFVHTFGFICITSQVINDLLDPTGQNLRIREDAQVPHVVALIKIC